MSFICDLPIFADPLALLSIENQTRSAEVDD
jgi:hypothetical protein